MAEIIRRQANIQRFLDGEDWAMQSTPCAFQKQFSKSSQETPNLCSSYPTNFGSFSIKYTRNSQYSGKKIHCFLNVFPQNNPLCKKTCVHSLGCSWNLEFWSWTLPWFFWSNNQPDCIGFTPFAVVGWITVSDAKNHNLWTMMGGSIYIIPNRDMHNFTKPNLGWLNM